MPETYQPDTRVWIPDNDLGWISAKVVSTTGEAVIGGTFELKLLDERGKVRIRFGASDLGILFGHHPTTYCRSLSSNRTTARARGLSLYLRYATYPNSSQWKILHLSIISTSLLVRSRSQILHFNSLQAPF